MTMLNQKPECAVQAFGIEGGFGSLIAGHLDGNTYPGPHTLRSVGGGSPITS